MIERTFRLLLVSCAVATAATMSFALVAPAGLAATGSGADFAPSVRVNELHLQRVERGMHAQIHWRGPNRYRSIHVVDLDPMDDRSVTDQIGSTIRRGSGVPSRVTHASFTRNAALVQPDGFAPLDGDVMGYAWPLIARVRSGGHPLTPVTVAGKRLLRGTMPLAANECAALERGARVVDLDPATLIPRRVVERRAGLLDLDATFTPRRRRAADFAPLRIVGRQQLHNDEYVRRTPSAAAALVPWPVAMPETTPAGFSLAFTGSAPRGARLGPEASMPHSFGVFFARWTRGLEAIDFTIRPARSTLTRDWDESDPFGTECGSASSSTVMIGSAIGRYAQGEFGAPRLWWRDGTTLYTLSGPFSAEQLAMIARSLVVVEG